MKFNETLETCGSTNDHAKLLGEAGYPQGTWISTRVQENGRGRKGRVWESQEGNLFLSMIARIADKSLWTWIPLSTAVAVTRYLRSEGYPVEIKWPNDLWIDRAKLGGILCEATGGLADPNISAAKDSFIVIGLGINCAHAPEGLDQKTISLSTGVDKIRIGVVSALQKVLDEIPSSLASIREDYLKFSALKPRDEIEWENTSGLHRGFVEGVGNSGELLVRENSWESQPIRLYAEDVKLRVSR